VEAQYLLPLLIEEKRLLAEVGPEHPTVLSLRERIRAVRDYLERNPPSPAVSLPPIRTEPTAGGSAWPLAEPPARVKPPPEKKAAPPPATVAPPAAKVRVGLGVSLPGSGEECSMAAREERPVSENTSDGSAAAPSSAESPKRLAAPEPNNFVVGMDERREHSLPRFWRTLLGQALVTGGLLLAALVIHLVGLSLILRRFSKRFAWSARAASCALATGCNMQSTARAAPASSGGAAALVLPSEEPPRTAPGVAIEHAPGRQTGERFDVGPTYQEEMRLSQEAESQRQEGLLRHIFQDNLRLHARLEKLPPEAA